MIVCLLYLPLNHVLANKCVLYFILYTQNPDINALFCLKGMHPYFKAIHYHV